ncbi:dTDP-4-dehydrorhamnose reductase [Candidatus Parcubacteria bacterium]|nr:dTDP-4-dehydrorhamnose reductase [Candidatus Parcubacteria bacterium]
MRVLILGAKGTLGSQIKKVFSSNNQIFAWDSENVDITDKEALSGKINKIKPEIIINAAAYNAVDKCEENVNEFELAKKINGHALGCLADIAIKNKALLVHYSSDYIFGGHTPAVVLEAKENGGFSENFAPCPCNNYAITKLMGEQEILSRKNKKLKYYIIRLSWLFGPKPASKASKQSFFDLMIDLSKKQEEIKVVDDEVSSFTYAPDLALATQNLILSKKEFGIYHITNSGQVSWFEAAQELFGMLKSDVRIRPVSGNVFQRPAKRPSFSGLKNTKLKSLRNYKEALREYLKIK